jgi:hypothetical protein
MNFILENALIFIPVIYILGSMLKGLEQVQDKYIPIILLPIGVALSVFSMGLSVDSIVQGVLVVGAAVYVNQVSKQLNK